MRSSLALFLILLLTAPALTGGVAKNEPKLQGTWKLVAIERDGKKAPDDFIKNASRTMTFKGDTATFRTRDGKTMEGKLKIDTTKTPRHIEFSVEVPGKGAVTAVGIYELKGDTLTVAIHRDKRPTNFEKEKETYQRVTE
jgi:uncharacterized protein (TIGR03067 family)